MELTEAQQGAVLAAMQIAERQKAEIATLRDQLRRARVLLRECLDELLDRNRMGRGARGPLLSKCRALLAETSAVEEGSG